MLSPQPRRLAATIRSLAPRKAPGHDGLPTTLRQAVPHTFAALLHLLKSKVVTNGGEPTAWKALWSRLLPTQCGHTTHPPYRYLRTQLNPLIPLHNLPAQCGARSTDFGAHLLRPMYAIAHQRHRMLLTIDIDFT